MGKPAAAFCTVSTQGGGIETCAALAMPCCVGMSSCGMPCWPDRLPSIMLGVQPEAQLHTISRMDAAHCVHDADLPPAVGRTVMACHDMYGMCTCVQDHHDGCDPVCTPR